MCRRTGLKRRSRNRSTVRHKHTVFSFRKKIIDEKKSTKKVSNNPRSHVAAFCIHAFAACTLAGRGGGRHHQLYIEKQKKKTNKITREGERESEAEQKAEMAGHLPVLPFPPFPLNQPYTGVPR